VSAHTPLPWTVETAAEASTHWRGLSIKAASGEHVANLVFQVAENERANARLIVTAVNAHADLLAALQNAEAWVALATGGNPETTHPQAIANARADLAALRAALAKAEGAGVLHGKEQSR